MRKLWLVFTLVACPCIALWTGCVHYRSKPLMSAQTASQFESRTLAGVGLRAFIETNSPEAAKEWPLREWNLDELTLAAIYFHPGLDVARAQWAVARAAMRSAGARPNPTVSVKPEYNVSAASGISPWAPGLSFDVPIETAGKRRHRVARASHVAEAARLEVLSQAWQVRSQVRRALADYAAIRTRLTLLQKRVELQEQIIAILEQRLAAGAVSANEVATTRVAATKWRAELVAERGRLSEARNAIAAAVGLPAKAVAGVEFRFELAVEADAARMVDSVDLRRAALQGRVDIRAALAEYAASQAALQLEIARQWPDVHLGPGYQWDQGEDKWSLGLSITLPVLNQNQGPIAEAEARRTEVAARFTALQAKVITELDTAEAAWRTAEEQLRQTEELRAAQARQLSRIEAAQAAGGADRLEIAAARLEVAAVELFRHGALVRAARAFNDVEAGLQRPVEFPEAVALRPVKVERSTAVHD
ncbi:MAG: TolC family protein [Verrucomicrobiales bacterium]|nr:TolC family protein [Verrucomicrobiales bacterium]